MEAFVVMMLIGLSFVMLIAIAVFIGLIIYLAKRFLRFVKRNDGQERSQRIRNRTKRKKKTSFHTNYNENENENDKDIPFI